MGDPIIQCDMCNAELTVNPSDLVTIVKAWSRGTDEGITVKQVTDICMLVYGSNVERALFLMLKRGELEITGMEKGQPLLRMAKKDAKPVEVSQPVTSPKPTPKPTSESTPKPAPKPTPESTPEPAPKPTLVSKQKLTRKRYDWKAGERLWNGGKTVEEIAEVLGCAVITVKKRARGRWKRRERPSTQTPKKSKPVQPTVRREKRGFVQCPACLLDTTTFPCEHCDSTDPKLHAQILAP